MTNQSAGRSQTDNFALPKMLEIEMLFTTGRRNVLCLGNTPAVAIVIAQHEINLFGSTCLRDLA